MLTSLTLAPCTGQYKVAGTFCIASNPQGGLTASFSLASGFSFADSPTKITLSVSTTEADFQASFAPDAGRGQHATGNGPWRVNSASGSLCRAPADSAHSGPPVAAPV